jgi:hypothetical protein
MDAPGILAIVRDEGVANCTERLGAAGIDFQGKRVQKFWKRDVARLGLRGACLRTAKIVRRLPKD